MTRRYGKKLICVIMVGTLLISIAGCGKRRQEEDVSQDIMNLEQASKTDAEETGVGSSQNSNALEETGNKICNADLEIELPGGAHHTVKDVQIEELGVTSADIYELSENSISDEKIAEYAEMLFDNGVYEIITPYEVSNQAQLKDEQAYYTQFEPHNADGSFRFGLYHLKKSVEDNLESVDTRDAYMLQGEEILAPMQVETNLPNVRALNIVEKGLLRGFVDGKPWVMEISVSSYGEATTEDQYVEILAYALESSVYSFVIRTDDIASAEYGENCSDIAVCESEANKCLDSLGISPQQPIAVFDRVLNNENAYTQDYFKDGYRFLYSFWQEDIPFEFSQTETSLWNFLEDPKGIGVDNFVGQPHIVVDTYQNKVQMISITNYFEERTVTSENVDLISMNQVLNGMEAAIKAMNSDSYPREDSQPQEDTESQGGTLKLRYCVLPYEDDNKKVHYNMMPVWVYYQYGMDQDSYSYPLFGIQAIDGSTIGFDNCSGPLYRLFEERSVTTDEE